MVIDKKIRFLYVWRLKFNKPIRSILDVSLGEIADVFYVLDLMEFVNEYVK